MDVEFVDHYVVLGLPSGEEGARLSEHDINKAYRSKAKELHPDKRRDDDPNNSHADFLKLQVSYQILKDKNTRKLFNDHLHLLRVKREKKKLHHRRRHGRMMKMVSDLEERERSCANFAVEKERGEKEVRIYEKLMKEEIARIIGAMDTNKKSSDATTQLNFEKNYTTAAKRGKDRDVVIGGGYDKGFEDSVLEKLKMAALRQKETAC